MKILAVSDLHFGLKQFDWLVREAPRYDVMIIAGDLLDIAGHLDLDAQILIVAKYLRLLSAETRVLVCSGNHDGDSKNEQNEYVARWLQRIRASGLVVDGSSCQIGTGHFSACPWWDGPATREKLQAFLRAEKAQATSPWIWVHHAPPDGLGVSWTGKKHAGDEALGGLIEELRPDFVFSGHIHNSPFLSGGAWASRLGQTWIFNAGKQLGAPPSHIVVDLAAGTASWHSQAGDETISLRDPAPMPTT